MDLQKNFFELFNLPVSFQIDLDLLAERYRAIQSSVHPDRYVNADKRELRLSLQYATLANEAAETLRSPLKRAIYLLQLNGIDVAREDYSGPMEDDFLLLQIGMREELQNVAEQEDPVALRKFRAEVNEITLSLEKDFVGRIEEKGETNLIKAETSVRKMQFMHKLKQEADRIEERFLDL
ncbi:MAG: Fe-S protein assembly co-chaperone HscB [Pseudomonadales bacterium]|nr:Fe-S protein assembly co-chaperone HscB [Pseudomonadales bacterium]MDP7145582.1 Fe-S protein assembly co-chaperone HscB [Pseudomonadales bacterium]MDP7359944.1 Fe-S protein assembly co-chaperone HscB [Pseudomonadales bacterium]MDP7594576.1 Fe-S protein assembly co-chaperone HscB [Pseudomonadales bacterium]HJN52288.1 Fe-S protein assembly co-chaperone HscB [Pseudomonadales bacterium]